MVDVRGDPGIALPLRDWVLRMLRIEDPGNSSPAPSNNPGYPDCLRDGGTWRGWRNAMFAMCEMTPKAHLGPLGAALARLRDFRRSPWNLSGGSSSMRYGYVPT